MEDRRKREMPFDQNPAWRIGRSSLCRRADAKVKISHVRHLQRAQAVCLVRETPYLLKNFALCLETDRGQSLVTGDCPPRLATPSTRHFGGRHRLSLHAGAFLDCFAPPPCSDRSNADGYRGRGRGDPPVCRAAAPCRPPARAQRAGLDTDAEAVVAFDIHDRKDDAKHGRRCAQGQTGCLRAFAGMTPVAMATATACVKFMQLNLWRAVSR